MQVTGRPMTRGVQVLALRLPVRFLLGGRWGQWPPLSLGEVGVHGGRGAGRDARVGRSRRSPRIV